MLPKELVDRVKARAEDPQRRTDESGISANTVDLGTLLGGEQMAAMQGQLQGFMGQFAQLMHGFGVVNPMPVGDRADGRDPAPLPPPADAAQVADAEAALGFALPDELKQLYLEIADGGFGPGGGLYSLGALVAEHEDMTDEPFGPQGQPWPANLLAIGSWEPGRLCVERDSGKVIFWDPEEIEGDSDKYWRRSFKPEADSLAALLDKWLGEPTAMERMEAARREASESTIQTVIDYYREHPEMLAEHGLPAVGWEEEVRRRHGGQSATV